jgi:hypothetical protein
MKNRQDPDQDIKRLLPNSKVMAGQLENMFDPPRQSPGINRVETLAKLAIIGLLLYGLHDIVTRPEAYPFRTANPAPSNPVPSHRVPINPGDDLVPARPASTSRQESL